MGKKGPNILPKIKMLIAHHALEEPRIPRDAVAIRLVDEIKRMGLIPPSEETIIKMVSGIRNQERNPLDNGWSIGSTIKYYFPPDIIQIIIEIQKLQMRSDFEAAKERITIRQAQWIARLYPLITSIYKRRHPTGAVHLWMVYIISNLYTQMEMTHEVLGIEYEDTTEDDEDFFINESFWDKSVSDMADYYMASRILYKTVLKDYGDDRAKKHKPNNNFQGAESQ